MTSKKWILTAGHFKILLNVSMWKIFMRRRNCDKIQKRNSYLRRFPCTFPYSVLKNFICEKGIGVKISLFIPSKEITLPRENHQKIPSRLSKTAMIKVFLIIPKNFSFFSPKLTFSKNTPLDQNSYTKLTSYLLDFQPQKI